MEEEITKKYKLSFIPDAEYEVMEKSIGDSLKKVYEPLMKSGITNFMIGDGVTVFIPMRFRGHLHQKAKKGEQL